MSDDQNPSPQSADDTPASPEAGGYPAPPAPPVPPSASPDVPPAPIPAPSPHETPAAPSYDAAAYGQPAAPAYGAPAPGAAPYGAAPYGAAPGGYGYGSTVRTNALAIISLVASIAGFLWIVPVIGPIAGVITGHISLAQIKRTGEKGRGMALAGTIVGWVGIGVLVLLAVTLIVGLSIAASNSSRYGA